MFYKFFTSYCPKHFANWSNFSSSFGSHHIFIFYSYFPNFFFNDDQMILIKESFFFTFYILKKFLKRMLLHNDAKYGTYIWIYFCIRMHRLTCARERARIHTCTHTDIYILCTRMYMCIYMYIFMYARERVCICV